MKLVCVWRYKVKRMSEENIVLSLNINIYNSFLDDLDINIYTILNIHGLLVYSF